MNDIETGTTTSTTTTTTSNRKFNLKLPTVTRWLILVLIVFYFVGFCSVCAQFLAMVPTNLIPGAWLWILLTSGFYHTLKNFPELIVNLLVIIFFLPSLEAFWGTRETIKFIFIINIFCALLTFLLYVTLYYITGIYSFLFAPVGGFYGSTMGILVGLKQLYSEEQWKLNIRSKHLPFLFLLLSVILYYFLHSVGSVSVVHAFGGLVVGWIYLRIFQYKNAEEQGDPSPNFKFSSLFPEIIQPGVESLSFLLCICLPKKTSPVSLQNDMRYSVLDSPEDAERRRQLALKVLDDKFQNMNLTNETKELELKQQITQ